MGTRLGSNPALLVGLMDTLDSKEAADILKLSVKETLELARAGEFPGVSWGNKWTFLRQDLLDWLAQKARDQQRERLGLPVVVREGGKAGRPRKALAEVRG